MADLGGMPKILTFRCLPREKWNKEHSELSDAGKPTAFVWITSVEANFHLPQVDRPTLSLVHVVAVPTSSPPTFIST